MDICRLEQGMIIPPTHLELLVVEHCNLSCSYCNHAAPLMAEWFADPDRVYRDFSIVAKYYRPRFVKILGGEPLLHPQLVQVIEAARATGISEHFTLTTNGMLLPAASDALWEAVDEVEISLYSGIRYPDSMLPLAMDKAKAFGKKLTVFHYDRFRATFSLKGSANPALISNVYAACKIANVWGCHAIRDGYFHKCPQSIYTARLTGKSAETDQLAIVDSSDFQHTLLQYLNSPEPLAACTHCVGTVGRQMPLAQVPKARLITEVDATLEDLVDHDWLERSLGEQDSLDDCKTPTRQVPSNPLANYPILHRLLQRLWPSGSYRVYLKLGRKPTRQHAADACRSRQQ